MHNYDTTKYREKESHSDSEPEPETAAFGQRAKMRHARLMEDAINSTRPQPADLGSGTASQAAGGLKRRREAIEEAGRE